VTASPSGAVRAGDVLGGRYLLLDCLGSGGPTSVWRARDDQAGRLVAVRVLSPGLAGDAAVRERFFRGARVTAELEHAAIVPVLEPQAMDGAVAYFVMALFAGGDLRQAVIAGRLDREAVLGCVLCIGDVLATAHYRGLAHLDVKPQNVLFDDAGAPWLTDFDLVSAPEALQAQGARADVHGLGMTAVFGLHGRDLPPTAAAVAALAGKLRCGAAIRAVLARAIDPDPDARFRDAATFCEALRAAMAATGSAGDAPELTVEEAPADPDPPAPEDRAPELTIEEVPADPDPPASDDAAPRIELAPEDAISLLRAAIAERPRAPDPYRRLYQAALEARAYDLAWCVASALAFLGAADDETRRFFEDYRPRGMPAVRGKLDNELWVRHLFHEDESLFAGKVFEMIAAAALHTKIASLRAQRALPALDRRFRQDPATSTVTVARMFGWAAMVLGLPTCPELYVRTDVPGGIVAVAHMPPASLVGRTLLEGFSPQDLAFILGQHLATYRGEHFVTTLFPTVPELTVLFLAAVALVAPDAARAMAGEGIDPWSVSTTAETLRPFLQPLPCEGLRMVVKKILADGVRVDVARWRRTVDLTASRAGLLLSGDLAVAAKLLAAEGPGPAGLRAEERMGDLLGFLVSERHQVLRAALGIRIAAGG
jgi:hypothetical protein